MRLFNLLLVVCLAANAVPMLALAKESCEVQQAAPDDASHEAASRRAQTCSAAYRGPSMRAAPCPRPEPRVEMFLVLNLALVCVTAGLWAWILARYLAACENERHAALAIAGDAPLAGSSARALAYVQEQTRGAGEFVILAHVEADLGFDEAVLATAVAAACAQDSALVVYEVAGHRILRRPRV